MEESKWIENLVNKLNKIRKKINLNQIVLSNKEKELILNLHNKIDNEEILEKIFYNYYFKTSFTDYINLLNKLIDNINDNRSNLLNNEKGKCKSQLKVNSSNLLEILNSYFDASFFQNKSYFYLRDNSIGILAMQSKLYERSSYKYWYTYHTYQEKELKKFKENYMLLYFKDSNDGLIVPVEFIEKYLNKLGKTKNNNGIGYHIHIEKEGDNYSLRVPYEPLILLNDYKLKQESVEVIKISSNFKQVNMRNRK